MFLPCIHYLCMLIHYYHLIQERMLILSDRFWCSRFMSFHKIFSVLKRQPVIVGQILTNFSHSVVVRSWLGNRSDEIQLESTLVEFYSFIRRSSSNSYHVLALVSELNTFSFGIHCVTTPIHSFPISYTRIQLPMTQLVQHFYCARWAHWSRSRVQM